MKEENEIVITYKHYIPVDWIEEIATSINLTSSVPLRKTKDKEEVCNFTGPEIADIIIFIKDNPHSIFLAPALYDIFKVGIVSLWKKLQTLNFHKIKSYKTANSKLKRITIHYEDSQNRIVKINIEGVIDDGVIESVVDKALSALKDENRDFVFGNDDFVDSSFGKKTVILEYNQRTGTWKPFNLAEF